AVGQTQLHDFEVVSAVDLPGSGGIQVRSGTQRTGLALTVVASASADRAVGVQNADGHAGTTIAESGTIRVTTHGGAGRRARLGGHTGRSGVGRVRSTAIVIGTVQQDSLEAGQIGRHVLEGVVDA